ncbi:MAG TPA: RHS repeat-associated core domain-containing protein [Cyclobacteriaceae bacterium]|nr:RHS repeat-associated core domain-containing protein [Cyclobacteriaceae bacterium]
MREVYFDDFKVKHIKSPVISSQDYYPFGLSFNDYSRENSLANQYQYNGKEFQDELNLGWLNYGWRMYQSDLGRFFNLDPHAEGYSNWTPYNYVANNPVLLIDPDGRDWTINKSEKDGKTNYDIKFTATLINKSTNTNIKTEDLLNLVYSIKTQIEDVFTIDEDNVSTSVSVDIAFSKDGKARDGDHIFEVVDNLDKGTAGEVDPDNSRVMKLSSSQIFDTSSSNDTYTAPHEAGHSAGLLHPDEGFEWTNVWSWFKHTPDDQRMEYKNDPDNVMFSGKYQYAESGSDTRNNNGKGYKINGNQARIIYENRDNKSKKK